MESQNVFLFAPNAKHLPALEYATEEIEAIARNHNVETYRDINRFDLVRIAAESARQDIYHFAGHLGDEGFALNDAVVSIDTLAIAIKAAEPSLVIFNTCSSATIAQRIATSTTSDCIFTKTDVYDDRSADFSIAFYAVLRRESVTSYLQACRIVDPSDNIFEYVSARNARSDEVKNENTNNIAPLEQRNEEINRLQNRVHELEQFVFGDEKLGLTGIRQELKGQRFWTVLNTVLTFIMVVYELLRITTK